MSVVHLAYRKILSVSGAFVKVECDVRRSVVLSKGDFISIRTIMDHTDPQKGEKITIRKAELLMTKKGQGQLSEKSVKVKMS